jgi:hypothetical protein
MSVTQVATAPEEAATAKVLAEQTHGPPMPVVLEVMQVALDHLVRVAAVAVQLWLQPDRKRECLQ